jgi:putative acetyltransferase
MRGILTQRATREDAEHISKVHYDAVHNTASKFYISEVINNWSPGVDENSISRIERAITGNEELFLVAKIEGNIVGFGSIVPKNNELRAVYVHSGIGRMGIGTEILRHLEEVAIKFALNYLEMDASSNAENFYLKNGYSILERGTHTLQSGHKMECTKMRKYIG